jgi:transposase
MHAIPTIITERVDDMPLLLEQRQRMGLPTLCDTHFPTHGNGTGLSLGWVSTIGRSAIVSRGDHRVVHVEPWVAQRLWTLGTTTGHAVTRLGGTDDRLAIVRRCLREDTRWAAWESALHPHPVRVDALATARVHGARTSASASATGRDGGLCPFAHRQDDRPAWPQSTVRQAVLEPVGMPRATDGGSGERADAPLSRPCLERVQARGGRHGLF